LQKKIKKRYSTHTHSWNIKHEIKKTHKTTVDQLKRNRKKRCIFILYFFFFLRINHHNSVTGIVGCSTDDDDDDEYVVDVKSFRFGSVL
jgi:hypothetical protein